MPNWNNRQVLTDSLNFEEKFSAAFTEKNSLIASVLETEISLEETKGAYTGKDLEEDKQLNADERAFSNIPVPGRKNIVLLAHAYANDLQFLEKEIEFSSVPKTGEKIIVKTGFRNQGDTLLDGMKVQLVDESSGQPIQTKTINNLKAGKMQEIWFEWIPGETNISKNVSIVLDPYNEILESNEENNKKTALAFAPDLQIISLQAETITENSAVLRAIVKNNGNAPAMKTVLAGSFSIFREFNGEKTQAQNKSIYNLKPLEEKEILVAWDISEIPAGKYRYFLSAGSQGQNDFNEKDNEKNILVEILPNITTSNALVFLEENSLKATIKNNGARETGPFSIEIFDGETSKRTLAVKTIDSIAPNSEATVSIPLESMPANNYFVLLDSKSEAMELYENDNLIQNTQDGAIQLSVPFGPVSGNANQKPVEPANLPQAQSEEIPFAAIAIVALVLAIAGIIFYTKPYLKKAK